MIRYTSPDKRISHLNSDQIISYTTSNEIISHLTNDRKISYPSPDERISHLNNDQMMSYTSSKKRISHPNHDKKLLDPVQTNKQFSDPYLRRKTAIVPSFPLGITLQVPRVLPSCEIGNKPFQTPQLYNSNSCLVVSSS